MIVIRCSYYGCGSGARDDEDSPAARQRVFELLRSLGWTIDGPDVDPVCACAHHRSMTRLCP